MADDEVFVHANDGGYAHSLQGAKFTLDEEDRQSNLTTAFILGDSKFISAL